jgi:hypothetical protein
MMGEGLPHRGTPVFYTHCSKPMITNEQCRGPLCRMWLA